MAVIAILGREKYNSFFEMFCYNHFSKNEAIAMLILINILVVMDVDSVGYYD